MKKNVWKITFEGQFFDGQKPEIVKNRLASLLKADLTKVERMFRGGKVILKSGIDYPTALKFQEVFQRTGAKCRIIHMEHTGKGPLKSEKEDTLSPPSQNGTNEKLSASSPLRDKVLGAFQGDIDQVKVSGPYKIGLPVVGTAILLLPFLYIALMLTISYGMYYHATENMDIIASLETWKRLALLMFGYVVPIVFGIILTIFMLKPIFAPRPPRAQGMSLNPYAEEVLIDFLFELSGIIKAPMPRRIEVDCDVGISTTPDIGVIGLFKEDLVLKLGLPLVAGLNAREFAGLLARELGHFSHFTGRRFPFVITSMMHWFSDLVYVRDLWDEKLEIWFEGANFRLRAVLNIARFFIWITRKIMWVFLKAGHVVSFFLMRQMEFNADRYQIQVAGSKPFSDTCLRLHTLHIASEQTTADLREKRENTLFIDNLPDLILTNSNRIPSLTETRVKRHIIESKTGILSNRPSDRDRIVNAFKENADGIFVLEGPAKQLFSNFDRLSREATMYYYRDQLGLTATDDEQVSVQAFIKSKDNLWHGHGGLERYFCESFQYIRPLPFKARPETGNKPVKQRIEGLLKTLNLSRKAAPKTIQALNIYEKSSQKELAVLEAKLVLQANLSTDTSLFQLIGKSIEAVEKALNKALSEKSAADSLLHKVEVLLTTRFDLALSLLDVSHISKYITDAEELKKESLSLLDAYVPFSSTIGLIHYLNRTYRLLTSLIFHRLCNPDNEVLDEMIQNMREECKGHLTALYGQLKDMAYPFDHDQADISIAEIIMRSDPEEIDEKSVLRITESVIDRIFIFHARLLGRLAHIAGIVEEVVRSQVKRQTKRSGPD